MSFELVKNVVYLNSSQVLPPYLQAVKGVRWNIFQDLKSLNKYLMEQKGEVTLVVKSTFVSLKAVEVFLAWGNSKIKLSIIFIAQTVEKKAYQLSFTNPKMIFLYESQGERLSHLVTRCIRGDSVKSRKFERVRVLSQVMLKKSVITEKSPVGGAVQFLRDGQMQDFSRGGACITLKQGGVREKDFISVMYQNRHGLWVSVESQVRWVVSTIQGDQIIGVQFLAVSA